MAQVYYATCTFLISLMGQGVKELVSPNFVFQAYELIMEGKMAAEFNEKGRPTLDSLHQAALALSKAEKEKADEPKEVTKPEGEVTLAKRPVRKRSTKRH